MIYAMDLSRDLIHSPLLTTALLLASIPHIYSTKCPCGYSVPTLSSANTTTPLLFTDAIETDFTTLQGLLSGQGETDWAPQNYTVPSSASNGPWGKNASLGNVKLSNEGVDLLVPGIGEGTGGLVGMAELATRRDDILYGSLRAGIEFTREKGTCGAFFWVRPPSPLTHPHRCNVSAYTDTHSTTTTRPNSTSNTSPRNNHPATPPTPSTWSSNPPLTTPPMTHSSCTRLYLSIPQSQCTSTASIGHRLRSPGILIARCSTLRPQPPTFLHRGVI